jgi:hypothetical protein
MKPWLSLTTLLTAAGSLLALPVSAAAPLCSAKSGAHTVALVELYTSEGCDSCPPADRWLRTLPGTGVTPDKAVALSLHVDYWDYIGWKDPYAKAVFGERQKLAGAINKSTVVYTPQVMLAGRDFRRWRDGGLADEVRRINAQPARASIEIDMREAGAGRLEVQARAGALREQDRADAALYLAYYQSGLKSEVRAGENRGVTLQHDYVAREWSGPVALGTDGRAVSGISTSLSAPGQGAAGAVAFVQNRKTGEVLQALALPWCRG